jgi:hypothetical protein
MTKVGNLAFLTDQNVPDDVVRCLDDRGYLVSRVRDEMAANSTDPIVAMAAINAGRILVSWDRDFGHQRFMQPRFSRLSRIGFSCPEPQSASRLAAVLDVIEFAFARAGSNPVRIKIAKDKIQIDC